MIKKIINVSLLLTLALVVSFYQRINTSFDASKILYSLAVIGGSYVLFHIIIEGLALKRITNSRAKYSFRKSMSLLSALFVGIFLLRIWIPNPQTLLIAYGLFAAGVAISLQDLFKNIAGSLIIFFTSIYRVGDRIEIGGKHGDVIDIGLFYTTMLELKEWVNGDQATGRLLSVPNGQVLFMPVQNYTKDHSFIWDEIALPVTYHSDWKKALTIIESIVKKETAKTTKRATTDIFKLEERYFFSKRNLETKVYVELTDNWIMLTTRYVVTSRERRDVKSELMQAILTALSQEDGISIASQTLTITAPNE
ncbi:MAG: mechanosensitive ion channel [Candidatus Magasanikbacteria bacterium]|nr:mechanosensitive ion channel [Candidatus Magasanikbacteria bacterium]